MKLAKQATKRPNVIVFSGSFHGRTHLAMAMTTSKTGYRVRALAAAVRRVRRAVPRPARRGRGSRGRRRSGRPRQHLLKAHDRARRDRGHDPRAGARRGRLHRRRRPGSSRASSSSAASTASSSSPTRCSPASGAPGGCSRSSTPASSPTSSAWPRASRRASRSPRSARRRSCRRAGRPGSHGGTYGGNPIGCAAALATIEVHDRARASWTTSTPAASSCMAGLRAVQAHDPGIIQVRGLGLMVGTEFNDPARVARDPGALSFRRSPDIDERGHVRTDPQVDATARRERAGDRPGPGGVRRRRQSHILRHPEAEGELQ